MTKKIILCIILLAIFFAKPARSCVIGSEYPLSFDQYIGDAKEIFLGRVIEGKFTGDTLSYKFEVLEWIRTPLGANRKSEAYSVFNASHPGKGVNLGEHINLSFWNGEKSGVPLSSDCTFTPSLRLGVSYLVIEGKEPSRYDYEMILDRNDHWYRYVVDRSAGAASYPFDSDDIFLKNTHVQRYSCEGIRNNPIDTEIPLFDQELYCLEADSLLLITNSKFGKKVVLPMKGQVVYGKMASLMKLPHIPP